MSWGRQQGAGVSGCALAEILWQVSEAGRDLCGDLLGRDLDGNDGVDGELK